MTPADNALSALDNLLDKFCSIGYNCEPDIETLRTYITSTAGQGGDAGLLKKYNHAFEKGEFLGTEKSAEFIKGILQPDKCEGLVKALEELRGLTCYANQHKIVDDAIKAYKETS